MSPRMIMLAACAAALLPLPAMGQSARYADNWIPPDERVAPARPVPARPDPARLPGLLRELDRLTTAAERSGKSDPKLLSELRALIARYARHWPRLVLKDMFQEGNLNPRWVVESGRFRVTPLGLVTRRNVPRGARRPGGPPPAARTPNYGPRPGPPRPRDSRLSTRVGIPNAFALRVTLSSRAIARGAFEMGVGRGARGDGYRLDYRPTGTPSLTLIRDDSAGRTVLGAMPEPLHLEDGQRHRLELARDLLGEITASVDGRVVVRVHDDTYRANFDSVILRNTGGDYAVRGVVALGAVR